MTEDVCQGFESARGAGHDALRIGLVDGKQRDNKIADGSGANDFIGADNGERHRAGADHIDGGRAGAARCDRHIQSMSLVDAINLSGIKSSELRLRLPVQLQRDLRPLRTTG